MSRPDAIRRTPGYLLGRVHAYRDRGAGYVDGFRTSLQAGVLVSGVAFGAKFTDGGPAVWLGVGVTVGLEVLKIIGGWVDWRLHVIRTQHLFSGFETNPVSRWNLELLEEIAVRLGASREWAERRRAEHGLEGWRAQREAESFGDQLASLRPVGTGPGVGRVAWVPVVAPPDPPRSEFPPDPPRVAAAPSDVRGGCV